MLTFVTFFAQDIERTADVYRLLGLDFISEQHGAGPVHLACVSERLVLEIYPGEDVASPGVMVGLEVADLDQVRTKVLEAEFRYRGTLMSSPVCVVWS
ncbi:hypothetical protein [Mesorhizobium sp.]|uniref:VOC family protein n=1 Tax=Mesorhizobium sp. TaxID=1871066 RepID=UPI000FE89CC6|nr:hypothetical protein [Mesorhizobium sp.]RWC58379.1 MAG: hypothetical protein EOS29_23420 [Mesorhizobium sp.]RWC61611.1 MAG: hypothetical protein EOS56_11605 [Mesorhizobium sp.]